MSCVWPKRYRNHLGSRNSREMTLMTSSDKKPDQPTNDSEFCFSAQPRSRRSTLRRNLADSTHCVCRAAQPQPSLHRFLFGRRFVDEEVRLLFQFITKLLVRCGNRITDTLVAVDQFSQVPLIIKRSEFSLRRCRHHERYVNAERVFETNSVKKGPSRSSIRAAASTVAAMPSVEAG